MEYIKIISLFVFCVSIESKKCESGYKRILCDYPDDPGAKCNEFMKITLTDEEKSFIVEEHNRLRHQIATGNGTLLPKAYFMKKLFWDEELAELAHRWANQCGEPFNDDKKDKYLIGANRATITSTGKKVDLSRLMDKWKLGLSDMNGSLVKDFRPQKNEKVQQTSQIIWANTDKIGCGISQYEGRCKEMMHNSCPLKELVCFYSPAGNFEGVPIYLTSENKDLICAKNEQDVLCDKIIHKGGKIKQKIDPELEEILLSERTRGEYNVHKIIRQALTTEGETVTKACTNLPAKAPSSYKRSENNVPARTARDATVESCKEAVKTYLGKVNGCYGKPADFDGKEGTADHVDKLKDVNKTCGDDLKGRETETPCLAALKALDELYKKKLAKCETPPTGTTPKPASKGIHLKSSNAVILFILIIVYFYG